jgi:hypothetical protein
MGGNLDFGSVVNKDGTLWIEFPTA